MAKWQLSRIQYGFGLGVLVAVWIHFPGPRALFAFAVTSMLTALRFRALGWKPSRACSRRFVSGRSAGSRHER
jgi:hypothetical protein